MKRKNRKPRRSPSERFLDEVGRWLKAHGGAAAVAGPIRLVEWPEDQARNLSSPPGLQFFAVDVKVMGKKPPKEVGPITPPPNAVHRLGAGHKTGPRATS